jgi:hypothetical protein
MQTLTSPSDFITLLILAKGNILLLLDAEYENGETPYIYKLINENK